MSDKPFFEQVHEIEALIEEANGQSPPDEVTARSRKQRPERDIRGIDIPPTIRTIRAMRNRRRVIE